MEFHYQKLLAVGKDNTPYRLLTKDHVSTVQLNGQTYLTVQPEGLELLAREALRDVSFFLRPTHLQSLANILEDPEASDNDRFVAHTLLQNAKIAAEGRLPSCQDTGTAIVMGKKGERVLTGVDDAEYLSKGIFKT